MDGVSYTVSSGTCPSKPHGVRIFQSVVLPHFEDALLCSTRSCMRVLLAVLLLMLAACSDDVSGADASIDAAVDAAWDLGAVDLGAVDAESVDAAPDLGPADSGMHAVADELDVLFVINNAADMAEEQNQFAIQLPRFARILAEGDLDTDGEMDFRPVPKIQLGVVTGDMGTMGYLGIDTCDEPMFGDDGILRTEGNTASLGCMAMYDSYLAFDSEEHPTDVGLGAGLVAQDSACVARAGEGGCMFQSLLEAALKAVTPSADTGVEFFGPSLGHGDEPNAGLINPNAVVLVVVLSNTDDCSVDPNSADVYNRLSAEFTGELSLRCHNYPSALRTLDRYVSGFHALRTEYPERVIFGAIAGIPDDLLASADPNYAAILADERMQEVVPSGTFELAAACTSSFAAGTATPARRLVQTAAMFAPNSFVSSICANDLVSRMAARVASAFPAP